MLARTGYSLRLLSLLLTAVALVTMLAPAAHGSDRRFDVAAIAPELVDGANAVIRVYDSQLRVTGADRAQQSVRKVITIFNAAGRSAGTEAVFYDKFRKIKKLNGLIRNPNGDVFRKIRKQEIRDVAVSLATNLFDDNRVRYVEMYHDAYPYTVEIEYEIEYKGMINWPAWIPQIDGLPVENAALDISLPAPITLHTFARHLEIEPVVTEEKGNRHFRWEIGMLPRLRPEPLGPPLYEQIPALLLAPSQFAIDGYAGSLASWQEFGAWYWQLNEGRDMLPEAAVAAVQQRISGVDDPVEQARALYTMLQEQTRYVSIQLGIGGWQTIDAATVFATGYGDCKALSNYMIAMLKAAAIPAYPVLINSGADAPALLVDFPSNQFNHVIVCVPMASDTLWLECTSQTIPFNHIGAANENRHALLVTSDGGVLVQVPASSHGQNQQLRRATIDLRASGDADAQVTTVFTGNQQDRVRQALAQATPRDREVWLNQHIAIPRYRIRESDLSEASLKSTAISIHLNLELPKYASRLGNRLFLNPNLMEQWKTIPEPSPSRTQPVQLSYAYEDIDSITYKLPDGFVVEAMPAPIQLDHDFGSFSSVVELVDARTLLFRRHLVMREPKMPAARYEDYRVFTGTIVSVDRAQVVLVAK